MDKQRAQEVMACMTIDTEYPEGADEATATLAGSNAACGDWTSKRMPCGGELTVRW